MVPLAPSSILIPEAINEDSAWIPKRILSEDISSNK